VNPAVSNRGGRHVQTAGTTYRGGAASGGGEARPTGEAWTAQTLGEGRRGRAVGPHGLQGQRLPREFSWLWVPVHLCIGSEGTGQSANDGQEVFCKKKKGGCRSIRIRSVAQSLNGCTESGICTGRCLFNPVKIRKQYKLGAQSVLQP
jgi:hypothetical protein